MFHPITVFDADTQSLLAEKRGSGAEKYPIWLRTREIFYLCLKECLKYSTHLFENRYSNFLLWSFVQSIFPLPKQVDFEPLQVAAGFWVRCHLFP